MEENSITRLIQDLKAGDEEAARQLWERYFERLVTLAQSKLSSRHRRAADEEDVALSVFKSLCRGAANGNFTELTDRVDLWHLLLRITHQKTVDHHRRESAQKRGDGEVRGESIFQSEEHGVGFDRMLNDAPNPEFLNSAEEQFNRLLGLLRNDELKKIAIWRMEGFTNVEIAKRLGVSSRSIERKVKLIRQKWERLIPDDSG